MAGRLCCLGLDEMGKVICRQILERVAPPEPMIIWSPNFDDAVAFHRIQEHTVVAEDIKTAFSYGRVIWHTSTETAVEVLGATIASPDMEGILLILSVPDDRELGAIIRSQVVGRGGSCVFMKIHGAPSDVLLGTATCELSGKQEAVDRAKAYMASIFASFTLLIDA